jgi:hypothetical protein
MIYTPVENPLAGFKINPEAYQFLVNEIDVGLNVGSIGTSVDIPSNFVLSAGDINPG